MTSSIDSMYHYSIRTFTSASIDFGLIADESPEGKRDTTRKAYLFVKTGNDTSHLLERLERGVVGWLRISLVQCPYQTHVLLGLIVYLERTGTLVKHTVEHLVEDHLTQSAMSFGLYYIPTFAQHPPMAARPPRLRTTAQHSSMAR
jgi:hypothetical protein